MKSKMMIMKRVVLAALATTALTAGVAGQDEQRTVRYAYIGGVADAIVPLLGEHVGIYSEHNIVLDNILVAGGTASAAALVSDSADVTHTSAATIFPVLQQGAGIRFLMYNYDIDYQLIVQPEIELPNAAAGYPQSLTDLKGLTIGVGGRGGGSERYVNKMVEDAGYAPEEVTFVVVGTGVSAVAAFQNKQVEALVALPPVPTLLGDDNFKDMVSLETTQTQVYNPNFLFTTFSAGTDFLDRDPELAQDFCRATRQSIEYIRDPANTEPVSAFFAEYLNLPIEQASDIVERYRNNFRAELTPEMWEGMKEFSDEVPEWASAVYEPCATIASE
ncbi:ABC transporter substrate-binding protein [Devosia sp. YIM 151766]|uniref:ABC transporter substrate-binding protein n=1 Tax=Devosia sp. YIM 151766 TaxID=3017325 RepID=UPI00255CF6EF|nr:ABC transporter substrate-binding protein [Devosia sp. YIM 151766]WIY53902.1 ABC transporter substrate-binding protein [Devosia sp. YIM 151766]